MGPRFWSFYVFCIVGKINNVVVCQNHVNMCLRDALTWKL